MPTDTVAKQFVAAKQEALQWLRKEMVTLRSGRVQPDMIASLMVESYGTRSPLNSLASIANSDARTLVVSPWDKNILSSVEKAITEANLGVNPIADSDVIRLSFPSLTQEAREKTTKILHDKAEEARVRLRLGRDNALRILREEKEEKKVTEDEFYDGKTHLDELINAANKEVAEITEAKEKELQTI